MSKSPVPKRQPEKIAQEIKKTRPAPLPPLKTAEKIAEEVEVLPAVRFSFMQKSLQSPYSLPQKVGQLLFKENLVDINGKKNFPKLIKLKNPHYLNLLKAKIIFIISQNWLKNIFKQGLRNNLDTLKNQQIFDPDELSLLIDFFASRYSTKLAIYLLAAGYSHLLMGKNYLPKPIKQINQEIKPKAEKFLKKEKQLIKDVVIEIKMWSKKDLSSKQKDWLNKTAETVIRTVKQLINFPSVLKINLDPISFPNITFEEVIDTNV